MTSLTYRHVATPWLMRERAMFADMLRDLNADPATWDYPEETREYLIARIEMIDEELRRRHPGAAPPRQR
jgi:hypothetical protein